MFKSEGSNVIMGYCFGVDYIVLYRSTSEGHELLGNSSNKNTANTSSTDLQDRIEVKEDMNLLGLQINELTELDSGIYWWECWRDQEQVSSRSEQVSVCRVEVSSEQITVSNDGGAELVCNRTSTDLKGTSVRWYREMYPDYIPTLFLDSRTSLEPFAEELQGLVEARDNGQRLMIDKAVLTNNPQFYCLVIKGESCLTFQNMHLEDLSESREIFASIGDAVVLNCSADGNQQQWDTPLGEFNSTSKSNQMYITTGHDSEDFSLIIPVIADEHSGKYSCISPSVEIEYSLFLCPKNKSQEKVANKGSSISLECISVTSDSHRLKWQRRVQSGHYEVIADTENQSSPIPDHLSVKMSLSDSGHLLTISDVDTEDAGVYSCVVFQNPGFLYEGEDYEDYEETSMTDYENTAEEQPYVTEGCIFKRDVILTIAVNKTGTLEEEKAPNVTTYAVVAGVVGLLLAVAVVVFIARKRNRSVSKAKRTSTLNTQMGEDPGCMDRLTSNNDVA